jgi:hypothetical protein
MVDFTILIPVFEETDALVFSTFYFNSLGLRPIYVLDSKRIGRRDEVERIVGREVVIYDNPGMFIEANYEKFTALAPTDWILRIDCDEAVTAALIDHADQHVKHGLGYIKGYNRRQMRWNEGGFQAVKHLIHRDIQYRLFDRRKVRVEHKIHTPGYKVPVLQMMPAPGASRIYHLQFLFESPEQRQKKGALYRSLGQAEKFNQWFETPVDKFKWESLEDTYLLEIYRAWRSTQGLA